MKNETMMGALMTVFVVLLAAQQFVPAVVALALNVAATVVLFGAVIVSVREYLTACRRYRRACSCS